MRHNNNGRRFRGRNNNNGGGSGGGGGGNHQTHTHHHHSSGGGNNGNRRVNPRMHTFDSNGPEVRIRGNAYQIHEKYVALARDATAGSDRVLAESYLQHAEHYQRMINEMTEEYNKYNPQPQFQQQPITGDEPQPEMSVEQPQTAAATAAAATSAAAADGMNDLDQSFLRGPRVAPTQAQQQQAEGNTREDRPHRARETEQV